MEPVQVIKQQNQNEGSLRQYYSSKIRENEQCVADKMQNVRRLQAQRNEMNNKVRKDN
jgi:26S proteasome regulatory subunit T6